MTLKEFLLNSNEAEQVTKKTCQLRAVFVWTSCHNILKSFFPTPLEIQKCCYSFAALNSLFVATFYYVSRFLPEGSSESVIREGPSRLSLWFMNDKTTTPYLSLSLSLSHTHTHTHTHTHSLILCYSWELLRIFLDGNFKSKNFQLKCCWSWK